MAAGCCSGAATLPGPRTLVGLFLPDGAPVDAGVPLPQASEPQSPDLYPHLYCDTVTETCRGDRDEKRSAG